MVKQIPKMSARVISAIKNMREIHGSTSKEILNYVKAQYNAAGPTVQRQMYAALKRGLDYGILRKSNGHYSLNAGVDIPQLASALAPVEKSKGRRRRRSRRGRRRSGGKRRRRGRRGRSRRRRRGRGRARTMMAKRMSCSRCRCAPKRTRLAQVLRNTPVESHTQEKVTHSHETGVNDDRQSRRSKSRERSASHSSLSSNSDRELPDDQPAER